LVERYQAYIAALVTTDYALKGDFHTSETFVIEAIEGTDERVHTINLFLKRVSTIVSRDQVSRSIWVKQTLTCC
jgi:hypothetical protein